MTSARTSPPHNGGEPYLLSVHGADRLGIVAAVTRVVADAGGNITDLTTRLVGPLYVLVAEVDLPEGVPGELAERLGAGRRGTRRRGQPAPGRGGHPMSGRSTRTPGGEEAA